MPDPSNQANDDHHDRSSFYPPVGEVEERDLRVEVFTVCDWAAEENGRLTLVGTYELMSAPAFPVVVAQITIALRLRFWPDESGEHLVRLSMTNPDGRSVGTPMETKATLHPVDEERSGAYNLIFQAHQMLFEEPGEYSIDLHLNDRLEGRLPLCLKRQAA